MLFYLSNLFLFFFPQELPCHARAAPELTIVPRHTNRDQWVMRLRQHESKLSAAAALAGMLQTIIVDL